MRSRYLTTPALLCLLLASAALAQDSKLDLSQRFLLLATTRTSTMQTELKEAAAAGYRILVGSRTSGTEIALILEKVTAPPKTYEYYLLATTRTSTMGKELNDVAAKGFRLLPRTMAEKERPFGAKEIIVVMEKPPGAAQRYRYMLLATTRTSTLQKEMTRAVEEGYEVVGMVSRDEHIAILEKPAP